MTEVSKISAQCPDKLSFVTVVYRADFPLLTIQARSMAAFVDPDIVGSIDIVVNDINDTEIRDKIGDMLDSYGRLRDLVRVHLGDDVLMRPRDRAPRTLFETLYVDNRYRIPMVRKGGWRGNNGYRMQQAIKLASARIVAAEGMVILDAKNFFVRDVTVADYFDENGKARIAFLAPEVSFHTQWLEESLSALFVPTALSDIAHTTTFSTPFPVRRSLVLDVLAEVEQHYGSAQALFASKRRPSEFMLLNAYCLKHAGGPEAYFSEVEQLNVGIWPDQDSATVDLAFAQLEAGAALSVGMHYRAFSRMSEEQKARLAAILSSAGLGESSELVDVFEKTQRLNT